MSQNQTMPLYEGPAAWIATEMHQRHDWIVTLDAYEVIELKHAVEVSRAVPIVGLSTSDFPLPGLGERLRELQREVVHGRGFIMLRGLPVRELDRESVARMYVGMGRYFGDPVPQNAKGHLLGHVKDIGQNLVLLAELLARF